VLLGLRLTGAAPERASVSVLLSEKAFVSQPYAVGDSVRLSWDAADARLLGPGAVHPDRSAPTSKGPRPEPMAALASMAA
jgi:putative spermidine/putrescine transport system ATP-binding protein